jgi:hypothetical protein
MSRKITSDICFGLLRMILVTGGAWPQNAAAPADGMHQSGEWTTHAHDAQHTGVSPVASQKLATIHWQVPVDLAPPEVLLPGQRVSTVLRRGVPNGPSPRFRVTRIRPKRHREVTPSHRRSPILLS